MAKAGRPGLRTSSVLLLVGGIVACTSDKSDVRTAAQPFASTHQSALDTSTYNFESGTQGWTFNAGEVTGLSTSTAQAYTGSGDHSLAVSISATGYSSSGPWVDNPATPAGVTVTMHVWVPSGSPLIALKPYYQDANWGWAGAWIGTFNTNAWNTITLNVGAGAALPLHTLGIELEVDGTWNGTIYLDAIDWPGGSCTPTTCAAQGKNCGTISDGCGGNLNCGTCTSPQTCGGGGTANVCGGGCSPTTCAAQGKNCGTISDGCGGNLNCGTCTSPQTCGGGGTANVCGGGGGGSVQYTFDSSTQGWTTTGGMLTGVSTSSTQTYEGAQSLKVSVAATGADNQSVYIANPDTPAGTTVTFHLWIPSGSSITAIKPYVQDANWGWAGNYYGIGGLTLNGWNTLTLDTTGQTTPFNRVGVEINTDSAWTGSVYLDSVSWPGGSCTPTTCAAAGKNCGTISDGCGGNLNCGTCSGYDSCGGGGTANVCGCTTTTCAAQGKNCGTISDGCGGNLNCGSCSSPQTCGGGGTANVCGGGGCTPTTCAAQGKNCGTISDGCNGTLNCGSCSGYDSCGGGGTANVCGCTTTTCAAQGAQCGTISDGCGGNLNCGGCSTGQSCSGNTCVNNCTPTTCSAQGAQCGSISDGCGGTLNCGGCSSGQSCSGNVCTGGGGSSTGRYRSVSTRGATVTITGYTDTLETIAAYQQTADPTLSNLRGSTYPNTGNGVNECGVIWYPWSMTITLATGDDYWFTNGAQPEQTQVLLRKASSGDILYMDTADADNGPSDSSTCRRSWQQDNSKPLPLVYFNGVLPSGLDCSSSKNSAVACPFTCKRPLGCDGAYATTENRFYMAAYQSNADGQSTAFSRYDNYGANSTVGAPPGSNWPYMYETGHCIGGSHAGEPCEYGSWSCTGGSCDAYWVIKRYQLQTSGEDALNIHRGENRRNVYIDAWAKNKTNDVNNREIGLVGRWYNADNYFVFMVREYGGDYARLQRRSNGVFGSLASAAPSFSLSDYTRLGFKIIDNGSWNDTEFVPNGNCYLAGFINGNLVVSNSSTGCSQNPYGQYGLFSYYNANAQFWSVDVHACNPYDLTCL